MSHLPLIVLTEVLDDNAVAAGIEREVLCQKAALGKVLLQFSQMEMYDIVLTLVTRNLLWAFCWHGSSCEFAAGC